MPSESLLVGDSAKRVFNLDVHTVILRPLFHRGGEFIAMDTPYLREVDVAIRKLKGVKWSQTNKVWYLPMNRPNYEQIGHALKALASLNSRPLKNYLEHRKKVAAVQLPAPQEHIGALGRTPAPVTTGPVWKLSTHNLAALQRFIEQLKLKAYSPSTLKTYRNEFLQLLVLLKQKCVGELTPDDLRRYFVYCHEKRKLTENTLHSRINAVKFYFEQCWEEKSFFGRYRGPKSPCSFPSY